MLPQTAQHLPAIDPRHHDVQHDDLRLGGNGRIDRPGRIADAGDRVVMTFGIAFEQMQNVLVVVDDQHRSAFEEWQAEPGLKCLVAIDYCQLVTR